MRAIGKRKRPHLTEQALHGARTVPSPTASTHQPKARLLHPLTLTRHRRGQSLLVMSRGIDRESSGRSTVPEVM